MVLPRGLSAAFRGGSGCGAPQELQAPRGGVNRGQAAGDSDVASPVALGGVGFSEELWPLPALLSREVAPRYCCIAAQFCFSRVSPDF